MIVARRVPGRTLYCVVEQFIRKFKFRKIHGGVPWCVVPVPILKRWVESERFWNPASFGSLGDAANPLQELFSVAKAESEWKQVLVLWIGRDAWLKTGGRRNHAL